MAVKRGGLGRGLGALLTENSTEDESKTISLKITDIVPNRNQPRKQFDEDALTELSASIAQHGVLQPLLVRPMLDGTYQLVAGERRWRASNMAGLAEVPVVIREMTDQQASELALIENLQREDLNPMEEAIGFKKLMDNYGLTQDETAKVVNKSRPAVANALRLLKLPESVSDWVISGQLSAGHARALLAFSTEQEQIAAAEDTLKNSLSVRDLEKRAKQSHSNNKAGNDKVVSRNTFYDEVELALTEHLGRRVKVTENRKGGFLQIEFYSSDDLRMLANDIAPEK